MKIIPHRGNINGPIQGEENTLTQIKKCLNLGLEVEIDIRVKKNKAWLGYDNYEEEISEGFLQKFSGSLWIHCKNIEDLNFFK